MFGGLGRALQRGSVGDAQRITLEDPEFENLFAVYAHDETEARYLLTPNMMRRFVELSGRVGPFSASFHEEQLYIAIPRERGLFEVDMDRSVLDLAAVREVVEDVLPLPRSRRSARPQHPHLDEASRDSADPARAPFSTQRICPLRTDRLRASKKPARRSRTSAGNTHIAGNANGMGSSDGHRDRPSGEILLVVFFCWLHGHSTAARR